MLNRARLRKRMEESAREAGRDPSAIELSDLGPPDPEVAKAYADAGLARMIVPSLQPDLEGVKRVMAGFGEKVFSSLG